MKINFSKYQGAGNDFVMLDNLNGQYDSLTIKQIQLICDRRFGVGADGLIKINAHPSYPFEVDYYNADGSKSFCGNGGRCAVAFASQIGLDVKSTTFLGYDGEHAAYFDGFEIQLGMIDVHEIKSVDEDLEIYTGSPHYLHFVPSVRDIDIFRYGQDIRYNETYKEDGINVNAIEVISTNNLHVRTYERGVENETLACGTGVTAAAIAYAHKNNLEGDQSISIKVEGGDLKVKFNAENGRYTNVWLIGQGTFVFKGEITV